MYLLNDGARLELKLDATSRFVSVEERERLIRRLGKERLPLAVYLSGNRLAPAERELLWEAIATMRRRRGSIRIRKSLGTGAFAQMSV